MVAAATKALIVSQMFVRCLMDLYVLLPILLIVVANAILMMNVSQDHARFWYSHVNKTSDTNLNLTKIRVK